MEIVNGTENNNKIAHRIWINIEDSYYICDKIIFIDIGT